MRAEVKDLVQLSVGADARLGKVELKIEGVEAQALLKARLDNVSAILERVVLTLDRNPELLESVGKAVEEVGGGTGNTARRDRARRSRTSARARRARCRTSARAPVRAVGQVGQGAGQAVGQVGQGAGQAVGESARARARRSARSGKAPARRAEGVGQGAQQLAQGGGQQQGGGQ